MRSIKELIYEGLLDDMEDVLAKTVDDVKSMYPIPTAKDFKSADKFGGVGAGALVNVTWQCKKYIQQYVNVLDRGLFKVSDWFLGDVDFSVLTGIKILVYKSPIHRNKVYPLVYLCDDENRIRLKFDGVRAYGMTLSQVKKEILDFFKYISDNPHELKTLFEFVNADNLQTKNNKKDAGKSLREILKF